MTRRRILLALLWLVLSPLSHAAPAVRTFESDSLAHIESAHRGKPFVVVLWSLDCVYCQPGFAALAKAKRQHGVDVVMVATDRIDQGDNARMIAKKLEAPALRANAWAFGAAPPEQLRYAIDPKWHGETPRSYWYDATGARTARSGMITPQLISEFLRRNCITRPAARRSSAAGRLNAHAKKIPNRFS
jgi:thiol-disulfide isomerase/thioredoxin